MVQRHLFLGQKVCLNRPMMKESEGAIGYVYEEYGEASVSIIFSKGSYDGFSPEEQELYLTTDGTVVPEYSSYIFEHVGKVMKDYENGFWKFN